MRRAIGCLAGLAILSVPTFLGAQAPPLGGEQIVNAYTTGSQEEPKVSSDAAGHFNVVWESPQDGSDEGVFIERYENTGAKIGLEFQVNAFTPDNQAHPDVASDAGGNFVVVWTSYYQNSLPRSIRGQRFNSNGITVGGEFRASGSTEYGVFPRVAMNRDGAFVVVWTDHDKDGDGSGVSGQLFDSSGTKIGSEFQVNTYTTGYQFGPAVAMDRFGSFIIAWSSGGQDGSDYGIFAQRFDSVGSKAGPEFRVNTYTTGYQGSAAVATDPSGGFVVVWESRGQGGIPVGSFGQRFDRSGTRLGTEFPVPTTTSGGMPVVAAMSPEGFVVTWHAGDADGYGIFGQRFDGSGTKVGSEFQINSYTTGNQFLPAVASDARGGFVATWIAEGNQDGDQRGVARRRMNLLPATMGVDAHSATGTLSDADGVLEPGETVVVETAWQNVSNAGIALTGSGSAITGPPGGVYNLSDTAADYGTIPKGATVSCYDGSATHDCYRVRVTGTRPATHWDVSFREDVSTNGGNPWTLHVGRQLHRRSAVAALLQEDRDPSAPRDHGGLHADRPTAPTATVSRSARWRSSSRRGSRAAAPRPDVRDARRRRRTTARRAGCLCSPTSRRRDSCCKQRPLHRRRRTSRSVRADDCSARPTRHPRRDGLVHREGDRGSRAAARRCRPPTDLIRDRDSLTSATRAARISTSPTFPRRSLLQAHPLPLGQGNRRGLLADDLLPDASRHPRRDGQVHRQRVQPPSVRPVAGSGGRPQPPRGATRRARADRVTCTAARGRGWISASGHPRTSRHVGTAGMGRQRRAASAAAGRTRTHATAAEDRDPESRVGVPGSRGALRAAHSPIRRSRRRSRRRGSRSRRGRNRRHPGVASPRKPVGHLAARPLPSRRCRGRGAPTGSRRPSLRRRPSETRERRSSRSPGEDPPDVASENPRRSRRRRPRPFVEAPRPRDRTRRRGPVGAEPEAPRTRSGRRIRFRESPPASSARNPPARMRSPPPRPPPAPPTEREDP